MTKQLQTVQSLIDRTLKAASSPAVLEAGCGSASLFRFGAGARLVGIDISEKQLARNRLVQEKVLGDLERFDFGPAQFDVIVCWDVLEHLRNPERAIANLLDWTRPGGILVLGFPNVLSLKGLITKFTPHAVHRLAYKVFQHAVRPGKDDNPPFKTYLRLAMSPRAIIRTAGEQEVVLECMLTDDVSRSGPYSRRPLFAAAYRSVDAILRRLSFGLLGDSEVLLVLSRQPATQVQEVNIEGAVGF